MQSLESHISDFGNQGACSGREGSIGPDSGRRDFNPGSMDDLAECFGADEVFGCDDGGDVHVDTGGDEAERGETRAGGHSGQEMGLGELACDAYDHPSDISAHLVSPLMFAAGPSRRLEDETDMHVVLEVERPWRILRASPEWLEEFDFAPHMVLGRSLAVIQGPATHGGRFVELLETARWAKQAQGVIACYTRQGLEGAYHLRVHGVGDASDNMTYRLSFMRCNGTSWKIATADDGVAKAVIEASEPWRAVHVSHELAELYGLLPVEMLGRSLSVVHGPKTDHGKWASLLHAGASGLSSCAALMTSTRDCRELCTEVTVMPVLSGDCSILHVLLIFSPVDELASRQEPRAQRLPPAYNRGAPQLSLTHTRQQDQIARLREDNSMRAGMPKAVALQNVEVMILIPTSTTPVMPPSVSDCPAPMHLPQEYARAAHAQRWHELSLRHLNQVYAGLQDAGLQDAQDPGDGNSSSASFQALAAARQVPPVPRHVPARHARPYLPSFDFRPTASEHAMASVAYRMQGSRLQGSRLAEHHASDGSVTRMPFAVHGVGQDMGAMGRGAPAFGHCDVRDLDTQNVHGELHADERLLLARASLPPSRAPAGYVSHAPASSSFAQHPSSTRGGVFEAAQMGLFPVDATAPLGLASLAHTRYGWEMSATLLEQREEAFGASSEPPDSSHTGAFS
jgi:hypothetical protein